MSTIFTEWQDTTLEEICIPGGIQTGPFGSQLKASEYTENGIPIIMPKDLVGNQIRHSNVSRISPKKADELKRHIVKKGDIIFGRRGEIGRCALITSAEEGWICGTGSLRVRPSPTVVHSEFLFHYLTMPHVVSWLEANAVGQTMLNLSSAILARLPLTLPPLSEQCKFAEILSAWDEAIAKTEQLIAALQTRKKGLMQRLLAGEVRFPGFDGEWRKTELVEFFYPFSKTNSANEDLTVLSCSTIHGIVPQTVIFGKRIASEDIRRYKVVERGDLIYDPMLLWDASIGFLEVVEKGVISPAYSTFKFRKKSGNREYFKYLLKTHYYRQHYKYISQGTNVRRRKAPVDAFLKLTVTLPATIEEQNKIVEILKASDLEIELFSKKLEALKQQKKGLMQRLLTGQVRVKV